MVQMADVLMILKQHGYDVTYCGERTKTIQKFCKLSKPDSDSITWVKKADENSLAGFANCTNCVIVADRIVPCAGKDIAFLLTDSPKAVFFAILNELFGDEEEQEPIGKNTVIGESVKLAEKVRIGNNCSLNGEITIGEGTILSDNVVIKNRVTIGRGCILQAGCVIGEDGFGYFEREGKKTMIRHHGGVWIGNDVFIGSHVNIARGTMDDTIIDDGTKIAPSTHIAHNCHIGKNSVIINSQLYGSVTLGEEAYVVGSTIKNQCKIGHHAMIGMGSVVIKDIAENKFAIGSPARMIRDRRAEGEE